MSKNAMFKWCWTMALSLCLFVSVSEFSLAEPIAPPCKMNKAGLDMIRKSGKDPARVHEQTLEKIPSRASWHLPVYPGAHFASRVDGNESMFPSINLVSADPPEEVRAWYRQQLKGWSFDGMYQIFHEKKGKIDLGEMYTTQNINVMAENGDGMDLMFFDVSDVKTRIQIMYDPAKQH